MTDKSTVLIVDDTPDNLFLLSDLLKGEYHVKVANSGEKALRIAATAPQPDLILLDIMMPGLDGYAVCQKLKESETTWNIPVLFISALSDTFDIVRAFEVGGVDYITKPIQPAEVQARVKTHIELYKTRQDIQTLLTKTLTGSVKIILDLLSLNQPLLMEQSIRIRRYARELIQRLPINPKEAWNIDLATMLSSVGCVGIPQDVLRRRHTRQPLTPEEIRRFEEHPSLGAEMIGRIPRLDKVAVMIRNQNMPFHEQNGDEEDITSMGSAILQILLAFDNLLLSGTDAISAVNALQMKGYPLCLIEGLRTIVTTDAKQIPKRVAFDRLQSGMILAENLVDHDGIIIVGEGSELSASIIRLLQHFDSQGNCRSRDILVWEPA